MTARIHRLSCFACGAEPTGHDESIAVEVANLRAIGAAIGNHEMYGAVRTGTHLAGTVLAMLGEHARSMALIEVAS